MIKTKKSTSMIMSLISLLTAVIIFSTSVFASGVLNGLTDEDYTIDIQNNGEKIEFANKPFIENGKVYVPLRELLEKTGIMENPQSKIEWDNGKINVTMAYFDENDDTDLLYTVAMQIGKDGLTVKSAKVPGTQESFNDTLSGWDCTPILKNSITYIPHLYYGYVFMGRREIDYTIYGADKSVIDFSGYSHDFVGQYRIKVPNWWDSENYTLYKSPDGSTTYFAQRSSYDKYGAGTLFGISKVEAFAADEYLNMHKGSRLLYKNDEFSYIFIVPTDVQKPIWDGADDEDAETVKEYDKMYADVHKIADTFEYLGE